MPLPVRPSTRLKNPSRLTAMNVTSLGGTPSQAMSVRSEAFQEALGLLAPETRQEATARRAHRAEARLLAQANQAGILRSGETAEQVLDLRQEALNQLLGFRRDLAQGTGGRPVAGPPPPVAEPTPTRVPSFVVHRPPEEPAPPARRPQFVTDLQRALRAARDTEQALAGRRASIQAAPPRLGMGIQDIRTQLESAGPLPGGFTTPEQAFTETLFARTRREAERPDAQIAERALRAHSQGNTAEAERLYKQVIRRKVIGGMNLRNAKAETAMDRHLNGAANVILSHLGQGDDPARRSALIANVPPKALEQAKQMAIRGRSAQEVDAFLRKSSPRQQNLAAARQAQAQARQLMEMLKQQMQAVFSKKGAA